MRALECIRVGCWVLSRAALLLMFAVVDVQLGSLGWIIPSLLDFGASKMMWHAIVMSFFASIVAPFGGFFASGFKRAFRIKVRELAHVAVFCSRDSVHPFSLVVASGLWRLDPGPRRLHGSHGLPDHHGRVRVHVLQLRRGAAHHPGYHPGVAVHALDVGVGACRCKALAVVSQWSSSTPW
jgi:hypothetical protein